MEKKARIQSMGVAMSLGLVLGGLVGIFIDQMVVFAGGGMVLGLAVGLAIEKKRMAS